ncbi:hypothetical protein [Saccharibacillus sp. JS10]|uniref:hypothetical protein n=1 Tax=Saccharibacillus sp. JS10 TaxID=2950552 RepID=UPI00210C2A11|nr:hypothetical protein [Saccharibacillus sp. JS10]MCQ4087121.1 hypothetical protein [Saccharibacillus sp. JS10]
MRVIGILLIALGLYWIGVGFFFAGSSLSKEYPLPVIAISYLIFFFLPGGLFAWLGRWLLRRSKSRKNQRILVENPSEDGAPTYMEYNFDKEGNPISLEKPSPEPQPDVYRTQTQRRKKERAELVTAVCRSCGRRKTIRAGTSAQCDYCGGTVIEED